jgi:hypothetical protein
MKRALNKLFSFIGCGLLLTSCSEVVTQFSVIVGNDEVTTQADFTPEFELNLTGSYDIDVQDINYGQIYLNGSTETTPFQVGLTANLNSFTSDVWTGFEPVKTLPNGDAIPGWITPYELVQVDIPSFNEHFDLYAYIGHQSPYYLGVAVTLNVFDNAYPTGLMVSQNFRQANNTWGTVTVFGPSFDDAGNVLTHGGLFFVATFDPLIPGVITVRDFNEKSLVFHGKEGKKYKKDEKLRKKALKQIKSLLKKFNAQMKKKK